eukprot:SAG31_NODE_2130_length_6384_cov_8.343994_3_plen_106_part_00
MLKVACGLSEQAVQMAAHVDSANQLCKWRHMVNLDLAIQNPPTNDSFFEYQNLLVKPATWRPATPWLTSTTLYHFCYLLVSRLVWCKGHYFKRYFERWTQKPSSL